MKRNRTPNGVSKLPAHVEPIAGLMTPAEVALLLGVSTRVLTRWRNAGTGPRAIRLGGGATSRAVRYLRRDIDAYIESDAATIAEAANA